MPKSPYAAVNERRRKRAYNRRSTAQRNRRRREDPEMAEREQARRDYKTWLRQNAAEILAEGRAKARVPLAREEVPSEAAIVAQVEAMRRDEASETFRVGARRIVPVRGSRRARPHPRRLG